MNTFAKSMTALKSRINSLEERLRENPSDKGTRTALKNQKYKRRQYAEQKGRCCFCQRRMFADSAVYEAKGLVATIEHVIPKKKGGPNHEDNYKLSCSSDNNNRGTIRYDRFLSLVQDGKIDHYLSSKREVIRERRRVKKAAKQAECVGPRLKDKDYVIKILDLARVTTEKASGAILTYHGFETIEGLEKHLESMK